MINNFNIKNYLRFIQKPDNKRLENISISNKLIDLLKIYLITLLLLVISSLLKRLFIKLGFPVEFNQFFKELPLVKDKNTTLIYIVFALFLPPVLEEFSFRLFLTKYNKLFISISLSAILGYFTYRIFYINLWYPATIIFLNLVTYLYPFLFAVPLFIVFFLQKRFDLKKIWGAYFPLIFYIVTIIFAILHLATLNLTTRQYIFFPLIMLPFLINGISLGYTRIRYGLQYAILLHFILNAPVLLKILFQL